jgi:hypothetical protein
MDGTDEEKEIIRKNLIEKGIIKEEFLFDKTNPTTIESSIPIPKNFPEGKSIQIEETQSLDNAPKKRGRKPKK